MVRCAHAGRATNARSTLHEDSLELSRRPAHNVGWKECGYTPSNSERLYCTSSIFPGGRTQHTLERLAKRSVRVVANRLCYLEQFPIVSLQQFGRLVHTPVRQIFEWRFPKQLLESQCKG